MEFFSKHVCENNIQCSSSALIKRMIWVQRQLQVLPIFKICQDPKDTAQSFPRVPTGTRFELLYFIGSAPDNTMGQESEEDRRNRERSVDMLEGIALFRNRESISIKHEDGHPLI